MKQNIKLIIYITLSIVIYSCGQKTNKNININGIWEWKRLKKPDLIVVGNGMFVYFNDTTMITWTELVGYTYPVKYQINNSNIIMGTVNPFDGELNIISKDSFIIKDSFFIYSHKKVKDMTESQFFIEKNLRAKVHSANK